MPKYTWLMIIICSACDGGATPASFDAINRDAAQLDATVDPNDKSAGCVAMFGNELTNAHGRIDGSLVAVVSPGNERCALPNRDHVILQVRIASGVYRLVTNVQSDGSDPKIRMRTLAHPLVGAPFALGWHPGEALNYVDDLQVHSTDTEWQARTLADAVTQIEQAVAIGANISVFASSSGGTYAHSAHLIHRNTGTRDGAIVIGPDTAAPTWLLFQFANQTY